MDKEYCPTCKKEMTLIEIDRSTFKECDSYNYQCEYQDCNDFNRYGKIIEKDISNIEITIMNKQGITFGDIRIK